MNPLGAASPNFESGIRGAGPRDQATLVALMADYYAESALSFDRTRAERAFDQLLANPELGRVWLAELEGTAIGYIVLTVGFSLEYHGRDAFVDDLYVTPDARRRGVGQRLLEVLIRECHERQVLALHLEVDPTNTAASALYEQMGFREHSRQLWTRSPLATG